ncbi:MAG: DNA replication/repair protein RecF [Rhodospirillales bacterium]|nr:DNA replication/repair protein RecF [Rhodospirillales bacterium]
MQSDSSAMTAAGRVSIRRLTLTDFRCHAGLRLDVGDGAIALVGGNGVGKTSVLEAISLLAPGRGLRRARLAELGRWQGPRREPLRWAVSARLVSAEGVIDIGTGLDASTGGASAGSDRRAVRIDGQPARNQSALAAAVSVLWLTPEMDRLFTDAPAARRRFLDRIVFGLEPEHATRVNSYERAMRERLRLLAGGGADGAWLKALEWTMAQAGIAIAEARRTMASRLSEAADRADAGPFPSARVAVDGAVDGWLDSLDAGAAAGRFAEALARARAADGAAGTTTLGPHRSEIAIRHGRSGRAARDCSTGEQKALLIAIVLAAAGLLAAARGGPPILLLDEVAAHLDAERRQQLFAAVAALGGQAWYAGTDAATFAPLAAGGSDIVTLPPASRSAGGYGGGPTVGAVVNG